MIFKLIRTDTENPQKINLPSGTHLLGRGGNLLECTDKRISRNHGNLTLTNEKLSLKSLHINPCYFIKKNVSETQILKQDCVLNLNHGDRFGLLPDSYWYEVLICDNIETESQPVIPSNMDLNMENNNLLNVHSNTEGYSQNGDLINFKVNESDDNITQPESPSLISKVEEPSANEITGLIMQDEPRNLVQNSSADSIVDNQNQQNQSPDSSKDLEEQESRTPKRLHSDTENDLDEKKLKLEQEDVKPNIVPGCSNDQAGDSAAPKVQPTQQGRERCIYGSTCYRRNPQHLATYSHPKDADWGGGERGECPWGSRCRRRDPRHWLHHTHPEGTHPPLPPRPNNHGRATKRPKAKQLKKKDSCDSDSDTGSLPQELIVTGKRKRKPVMQSTDWKASDDDGDEDPFQTDESDEWQPNDSTQSQSLVYSQDYD